MEKGLITTLFLDVGGVLLTNGWDTSMRNKAIELFHLESESKEIEERHKLMFDVYEIGKISLDGYLDYMIFYKSRPFTRDEFKTFIFAQSRPYSDMLDLMKSLKEYSD